MNPTTTRPPKQWATLRLEIDSQKEELVSWLMFECGSCGVEVVPHADKVIIKASFPEEVLSKETLITRFEAYELGEYISGITVSHVREEDWLTNWKIYFEPFTAGEHLLICPPWNKDGIKIGANRKIIVINPGMAFGTGLHATTQYCLQQIEKGELGTRVLDVGTGSGILAIASATLHSDVSITALDHNDHAIENAQENVRLNKIENKIKLLLGEPKDVLPQKFNTILSNITCEDITALLPVYMQLLEKNGKIICAGILHSKLKEFEAALPNYPLQIIDQVVNGEWVGLTLRLT